MINWDFYATEPLRTAPPDANSLNLATVTFYILPAEKARHHDEFMLLILRAYCQQILLGKVAIGPQP